MGQYLCYGLFVLVIAGFIGMSRIGKPVKK